MESLLLICALILFTACLALQHTGKIHLSKSLLIIAIGIHLGALIARSVSAKHPPFTNTYETFILLPFLLSLRLIFWREQLNAAARKVITAMVAGFIGIALVLPQSLKIPKPLMPALNSIWMYIHVPTYFFGYMAMLVAAGYALMILFQKSGEKVDASILRRMDNEIRIAFYFLSVGMVTGAVWAYVSWGNYWAWDPKETWALINIIVLAFYFHLSTATKQKKAAVVILTLLTVAFTYWGVSFILTGLHSYT